MKMRSTLQIYHDLPAKRPTRRYYDTVKVYHDSMYVLDPLFRSLTSHRHGTVDPVLLVARTADMEKYVQAYWNFREKQSV
jgi:hypothetical protein